MARDREKIILTGACSVASGLNLVGGIYAVSTGQAKENPFFYFALTASATYCTVNGYQMVRECLKPAVVGEQVQALRQRRNSEIDLELGERRI